MRDIDFGIAINPEAVDHYHAEGYLGTIRGADWMIGDRRLRETSRTDTLNGEIIRLVEVTQ